MSSYQARHLQVSELRERNGSPRHEDDKIAAIVKVAVREALLPMQEQHRSEMSEIRKVLERMERGYSKLSKKVEAFTIGDEETAVAGITDGESEDLPNLPRYKADATVVYPYTASQIGKQLNIPYQDVAYFLGPSGLDWITRKPRLWNSELYKMVGRRLWHTDIIGLLREVIVNEHHLERVKLDVRCIRKMDHYAEAGLNRASISRKYP